MNYKDLNIVELQHKYMMSNIKNDINTNLRKVNLYDNLFYSCLSIEEIQNILDMIHNCMSPKDRKNRIIRYSDIHKYENKIVGILYYHKHTVEIKYGILDLDTMLEVNTYFSVFVLPDEKLIDYKGL